MQSRQEGRKGCITCAKTPAAFVFCPKLLHRYNSNTADDQEVEGARVRASTMLRSNDKHRIIKHYDAISPYYRSLWGEHLHHGYWIRGDESKEKAQLQLIEHLAQLAGVKPGSEIFDICCGPRGGPPSFAKH